MSDTLLFCLIPLALLLGPALIVELSDTWRKR
jgi:hypothetical protein